MDGEEILYLDLISSPGTQDPRRWLGDRWSQTDHNHQFSPAGKSPVCAQFVKGQTPIQKDIYGRGRKKVTLLKCKHHAPEGDCMWVCEKGM